MSRHRNVRQMDYSEAMDEDYEDDYYEDDFDPDDVDAAVVQVRSVLGDDIDVTESEIREAICYYALDTEQAIDWIIKEAAKKSKKKQKKEDKKNESTSDHTLSLAGEGDEKTSSIQFALTSLKSIKGSLPTTTTTTSLPTKKPGLNLTGLKQATSGLDLKSLAKASSGLSGLSTGFPPSNVKLDLKSLKSSQAPALSSIVSLQPNRMPSLQTTVKSPSFSTKLPIQTTEPSTPSFSTTTQPVPSTSSVPTTSNLPHPTLTSDSKSSPVTVPPSNFAKALFNEDTIAPASHPSTPLDFLSSHFVTLSLSTPPSIKVFDFASPSPDDIIASARSSKEGTTGQSGTKKQNQEKVDEKPSEKVLLDDVTNLSIQDVSNTSTQQKKQNTLPKVVRKNIDIVHEFTSRTSQKPSFNLVILGTILILASYVDSRVGHVDAGKSTLTGHLLYLLGQVSEKTIRGYERDAQRLGKSSFKYAWVLDATSEERSRGVTMDVAQAEFETEKRKVTVLDAPGHRDFVPQMITGAVQADVGLLVVDAQEGEFEAGFSGNGQTKEHALLARSLGISQVIVAVNKMDSVGWSEQRFNNIREQLMMFLTQHAGFKRQAVSFVPCSGLNGDNLRDRSSSRDASWYTGPTLLDLFNAVEVPPRLIENPLRLSVTDYFKGGTTFSSASSNAVTFSGRVDQGSLQIGDVVHIQPTQERGIVKYLERNNEPVDWVACGDVVSVMLLGVDIEQLSYTFFAMVYIVDGIRNGHVLTPPDYPVHVTTKFKAQMVVFDIKVPIIQGTTVVLHHRSFVNEAVVTALVAIVDKATGNTVKTKPRAIGKNMTAVVEIKVKDEKGICVETYKESREFGRFTLRSRGETVAAGIITEIQT